MDAPELHGALCGWLAGGGGDGPDWLGKLLVDAELPAIVEGSALDLMAKASAAQLEDQSFEFALMLPDDDAGLAERSGALLEWCRGLLGAFGLAAGKEPPHSDKRREALTDIARITAASSQVAGTDEEE